MTTSSSDTSTILTVGEFSSRDESSVDSLTINSASRYSDSSRNSYHSNSWEAATDASRGYNESHSERTETNRTLDSLPDSEDSGRRGGAKRKEGGGTSDSYTSSYYTTESDDSNSEISPASQASCTQRFIQAKLNVLKKPQPQDETKTSRRTVRPCEGTQHRHLFCQNTIRLLEKNAHDSVTTEPNKRTHKASTMSSNVDPNLLPSREIIDRLKIENLLSTIKKVASTDINDGIDSCTHCRNLQEANLQRSFVRQKTAKLENELTERRVDWFLSTKDPLTAIGDLVKTLPTPSDDPTEIWNRLMNPRVT